MKKVAIVGPESSGKTSLAKALAERLEAAWVPEFAREYLENLDRDYAENDLVAIAEGQLELERLYSRKSDKFLICDTNILVILIWSQDKFGCISPVLYKLWNPDFYHIHLLVKPDIPWEPDPLREDAHRRNEIFTMYASFLEDAGIRYEVVDGLGEKRLENALKSIRASK